MAKSVKQSGIPQLRTSKPSGIPTPAPSRPATGDDRQRPSLLKNLFALKAGPRDPEPAGSKGQAPAAADCCDFSLGLSDKSAEVSPACDGLARPRPQDSSCGQRTTDPPRLEVGEKVVVCGHQVGTLRYVGPFHRAQGPYCGVELDEAQGLNDGSVDGRRYFLCRKRYGILAPMEKVVPLAPPGAGRLRRDTFCIPKDSARCLLAGGADCEETRHVPRQSPPASPGCGADWGCPSAEQPGCRPALHELSKHDSFDQDESLGILSPDQMKTDLTMYGDVSALAFRHCLQSDDLQWARFADLTCEASLLDNQECPIYLNDTLDGDAKRPPSSLPLRLADGVQTPSDAFTPASAHDASDHTLSPEDLPLDEACDVQGDLRVLDVVEEHQFAGPSSAEPSSRSSAPPASSFVTSVTSIASITSITSLDTGYQGDGECSRPGSRGADHCSPTAGPRASLAAALRIKGVAPHDALTDSDFFTESDADPHDEQAAGRGDRKAQVIDGTLYGSGDAHPPASQAGGTAPPPHRRPSLTASANEEMESSGVYSDLERRPDEQPDAPLKTVPETLPSVQVDCSPDASTKTSSRSDLSQLKAGFPAPAAESPAPESPDREPLGPEAAPKAAPATPAATVKKYKMPKRNVVSKVKSLIDSSLGAGDERESQRPARTKSPKKGGRWDAVMSKIAQGQAENRWTPTKLKDVKSKVLMNILPPPAPPVDGGARKGRLPLPKSRLGQDSAVKSKSRRNRTLASSSQASTLHGSVNSSAHSSASDLSAGHGQRTLCKPFNKSTTSLGTSKKRDASPLSDGSTNSAASRPPANQRPPPPAVRQSPRFARDSGAACAQKRQPRDARSVAAAGSKRMQLLGRPASQTEEKNGLSATVADMKTPLRKPASRRAPSAVHKPPTPLREHNRRQQPAAGPGKPPEAAPAPRPAPEERLLPQLRHNSAGFEALGVLVHYLVFDLEAFATPQLRRDLEQLNGEWLRTRLELEEAQASYRRLGEEMCQQVAAQRREMELAAAGYQQQLSDSRAAHACELERVHEMHTARVAELEKQHQEVVAAAEEQRRELLAQLERARQEGEALAQDAARRGEDQRRAVQQAAAREAELQQRLADVGKENREEWRRVMDNLRKDKDSKLQVAAGRCKQLQDEVQSLQTVLELRGQEVQELRRQVAELTWAAEEVQGCRLRAQGLQARVEDLQAQLRDKTTFERQLSKENKQLLESFHEESKQKKRLSQHNEELQYKLKQNKEYMLAALSTSLRSCHNSTPSSSDTCYPATPDTAALLQHLSEPPSFLPLPLGGDGEPSPPQSPQVKSVVQKGDSVSWTLAMEEAPEIYTRLIRRAGSFRGTTGHTSPGCVPSPVRSRTLPPPKRQRCKATSPRPGPAPEDCDWPRRNLLEKFASSVSPEEPAKRSSPSESSNEADSPAKSSSSSSSGGRRRKGSQPEALPLPLPPLPGSGSSGDLTLLACSAPPRTPKESGGEAMISEETSEDEHQRDEPDSSGHSSDDSSSSGPGRFQSRYQRLLQWRDLPSE
ncbi:uncharacterized protein LOC134541304 isoform X3 [Bacillus rossius redtenbacheri]|uniref:uncharacterized protein LOC134541304 isoform X3 n=1 Tax=Bacillus rossius redtenbacheri TaxID=93214 RepID=UPI002FDEF4A0